MYYISLLLDDLQARVCRATEGGEEDANCRFNLLSLMRRSDPQQAIQVMQTATTADMCDQLEEASNIKLLEGRYILSFYDHRCN